MEGSHASYLRAGDVARRDVPTCRVTERVGDVRDRVKGTGQNVCIVTNDDNVVLGRLRREAFESGPHSPVEEIMENGPTTVRPDVPLDDITDRMRSRRVGSLLVTTSQGGLLGILYREDAERALGEAVDAAST